MVNTTAVSVVVGKTRPETRRQPLAFGDALTFVLPVTENERAASMKGNDFKRWRKSLDMSQKDAADALGLKRRVVQYYEKGERDGEPVKIPRVVRLACYAILIGVDDYHGPEKEKKDKKGKKDKRDKGEKNKKESPKKTRKEKKSRGAEETSPAEAA